MEDTEIHKIRKNFLGIKLSKTNLSQNKTEINLQTSRRPLFFTTNSEVLNKTVVTPLRTNNNPKLNQSCSLSFNFQQQKKRGRKKFLFDGIKTEVIDKAFLREFKSYIKKSKVVFKTIYDELKQEEKIFWNEFLQNTNPPFVFTQNRVKVEYKSFNRQLLKFIFSHLSVRKIYSLFIKEKEKDLMGSILNKKVKKIDRKMLLIYSFYGKNLHKLYSDEYNIHDINFEEIEGIGLSNFSDSLVINTSI